MRERHPSADVEVIIAQPDSPHRRVDVSERCGLHCNAAVTFMTKVQWVMCTSLSCMYYV